MTKTYLRQLSCGVSALALSTMLLAGAAQAVDITSDSNEYSNNTTIDALTISAKVTRSSADAAVTNSGTITGTLQITSAGAIVSEGADNLSVYGIYNDGTIGSILNDGSITVFYPGDDSSKTYGIYNGAAASAGDITNNGTISVGIFDSDGNAGDNAYGLYVAADAENIVNNGTLKASQGIYISGSANLISNTGNLTGIVVLGDQDPTIGKIENSGTITPTRGMGALNSGVLVLEANVTEIANSGSVDGGAGFGLGLVTSDVSTFSNSGTISGTFGVLSAHFLSGRTTVEDFTNSATGEITGTEMGLVASTTDFTQFTNDGTISATGDGALLALIGNYVSTTLPTGIAGLTGNAAIVSMDSTFGSFTNNKSISSSATGTAAALLSVGTSLDSISNTKDAVMEAEGSGLVMTTTLVGGDVTSFTNAGSITAEATGSGSLASGFALLGPQILGVDDTGASVGTWQSSGTISAEGDIALGGLLALSSVDSFTNSGTLEGKGTTLGGGLLLASVDMGSFSNSGTISGTGAYSGGIALIGLSAMAGNIDDAGLIAALGGSDNPILGILGGLNNEALTTPTSIDSFDNSGTITGGLLGLYVGGGATVGDIDNSGTISSGSVALYLDYGAKIGALDNSGTITGPEALALYGDAQFGTITNSGTIAGTIKNGTSTALTFIGGNGDTYGLITGYSEDPDVLVTGQIDSTKADILFQSGNIRLNSNIDVGTHTVTNNGNLRLDGTVNITGNYTQGQSGKLVIAATKDQLGKLLVSGTADLTNGTIVIVPIGGYSFKGGTPDVIGAGTLSIEGLTLKAGNDVITFSTETVDGVTRLLADVPDNGPTITYTDVGSESGPTGAAMGTVLDQLAGGSDPSSIAFQTGVLVPLAGLDDADQPAAIAALAPSTDLVPADVTSQLPDLFTGSVWGRLDARQSEPSTPSAYAAPATQPLVAAWQDVLGLDGKVSDPFATQVWVEALGGRANAGEQSLSASGLAAGLDRALSTELTLGVAGSWGTVDGTTTAGDGATARQTGLQAALYGIWQPGAFHLSAEAGGSAGTIDATRNIDFLSATAEASYGMRTLFARAEAGYDLPLGVGSGLVLTPLTGLDVKRTLSDAYTETGAGSANLAIDASTVDSLTTRLGGRLDWTLPIETGAMSLGLEAAWLRDQISDPVTLSGSLAGVGFSLDTDREAADAAELGLSVSVTNDSLSLGAQYQGTWRDGASSQSGLLRGTVRF